LSQFSRAQPSTGGFIAFVGKSFGGTSAVATALAAGLGYIIAMSSVIAISGGLLAITLVSTKIAGFFIVFEVLVRQPGARRRSPRPG
jgi:amino acid transporter